MVSKRQCVNAVADINQHFVSATWPLSCAQLCSAVLRPTAPSCSLSILLPSSLILCCLSPARPHPPSSPSLVARPALIARPHSLVLLPSPSRMHPHHTCHPLPAQTTDLCLPSLLSLNFAYPPVGEPNSEPISPPSPSQLQPDYYHHHARCIYCLGASDAMPAPMPALTPLLSTDTTP